MNGTNRNVQTPDFRKRYDRLPRQIQGLVDAKLQRVLENPEHPSLRLHRLRDNKRGKHLKNSISLSINMQYRAIYVIDGEENVWYWVGTHNDYETFIGEK
jgi:mRNA-degrading endonuclease RelE of RelBE toxin-antitoxin system